MCQRATWSAVTLFDVIYAPFNLRVGVGLPIRAEFSHLATGHCLWNAVSATASVSGSVPPVTLAIPQGHKAAELAITPVVFG